MWGRPLEGAGGVKEIPAHLRKGSSGRLDTLSGLSLVPLLPLLAPPPVAACCPGCPGCPAAPVPDNRLPPTGDHIGPCSSFQRHSHLHNGWQVTHRWQMALGRLGLQWPHGDSEPNNRVLKLRVKFDYSRLNLFHSPKCWIQLQDRGEPVLKYSTSCQTSPSRPGGSPSISTKQTKQAKQDQSRTEP